MGHRSPQQPQNKTIGAVRVGLNEVNGATRSRLSRPFDTNKSSRSSLGGTQGAANIGRTENLWERLVTPASTNPGPLPHTICLLFVLQSVLYLSVLLFLLSLLRTCVPLPPHTHTPSPRVCVVLDEMASRRMVLKRYHRP